MADNCLLGLDASWAFRAAPGAAPYPDSDSLWSFTESLARDNDALARALQFSLSDSSPSGSPPAPLPETRPASSTRNPVSCSPTGRVSKRKSRASKKSPTTYITADPANFRQMVQQVTGVRFGEPGMLPVEAVLRPEPQLSGFGERALTGSGAIGCLPTLDTSAVLLDRPRVVGRGSGPAAFGGPVGGGAGSGFDPLEGFSSFPTLESWAAL